MISCHTEAAEAVSKMTRAIAPALFCAVLYSCYALCVGYTYTDCGSTLGKFTDVSISGCQTSNEKCILRRGTNASISIKFTANSDVSQVNLRIFGILLDIPIPFPVDNPDVCKDPNSGIQCPLIKDQKYDYTTTMFVKRSFPMVNVDVKWELLDESKQMIVCLIFPAKIAN